MPTAGDFRSLISLRAKQGELAALKALPDDLGVQPLLVMEVTDGTLDHMLTGVERAVRHLHGLGRIVMADVNVFHTDDERLNWLEQLTDRLRAPDGELPLDPIPFVPVVRPGDEPHLYRLRPLADELGCGMALRVSPHLSSADDVRRLIARLNVADVDLIVDLRYVPAPTRQLIDATSALIDELCSQTDFRSTTLLSGSIPKVLRAIPLGKQTRHEEEVWRTTVAAGFRSVRFGDYGITHPIPSISPDRWSDHVAVKYSCSDYWLYVHQRIQVREDKQRVGEAVGAVSKALVRSGSFAGAEFSWGDRCFAAVAASGDTTGYGSKTKVVEFTTSHHLSYLASLTAA